MAVVNGRRRAIASVDAQAASRHGTCKKPRIPFASAPMITWPFIFLFLAIAAGLLAMVAAGPAGPILFFVFLAFAVAALFAHRRRKKQQWPPR